MIIEVEIGNGAKRKSKAYTITKDGFTFLAMGFTGKKRHNSKSCTINSLGVLFWDLGVLFVSLGLLFLYDKKVHTQAVSVFMLISCVKDLCVL